jgi:hypothetical protein
MNADEIGARLAQARQAIHRELCDLSEALGDRVQVEAEIDWLSVATHDYPRKKIPNVRVYVRIDE